MKPLKSAWNAMWVTFRNLFRPATTVQHPFHPRQRAPRYRATLALLLDEHGEEACIGCKMCENICPSGIIKVTGPVKRDSPATGKKRAYCDDFTINLQACIFCELCVQVCPADAISMCRVQERPGYAREDLVLTKEKLLENGKLKPHAWGIGSRFVEMHDPKRGLPPPPVPPKAPSDASTPGTVERP